jgi:hypothetical protein
MAPAGAPDVTVRLFQRALTSLIHILKKGSEAPDAAAFPQTRLVDDMLPLAFQVSDSCLTMLRTLRLITGKALEVPDFKWAEATTMAQLIEYAEAVQAVVGTIKAPDDIEPGVDDAPKVLNLPHKTLELSGLDCMLGYGLPNVYFHLVTAYNILRVKGVPLGKLDFITPFLAGPEGAGEAK